MEFEAWEPFYQEIRQDFGFSREKDEVVAVELDKLLGGNRVADPGLRKIIRGKEVTVAGNGPNIAQESASACSGSTSRIRTERASIAARDSGSWTGRTSSSAVSIATSSVYERGFRDFNVRQLRIGSRAAWTSSTRATAVLWGAECNVSGSSFTIFLRASTNPSSVSFVSVSVVSIMSASSTRCGKYPVVGWYPKSMT